MKATCHREGLLSAFQVASSVTPARSTKPILTKAKLEIADDGAAVLSATDLEIGVRYRVTGVVAETGGRVVLPVSEAMAILRELTDESIVIEATSNGVALRAASARFQLAAEDPLQFPETPDVAEPGVKIKAGVLANMIRRTIFAIASENSRYALHSILFEVDDAGKARMVATDGKRLALMPGAIAGDGAKLDGSRLLPPKALTLLQKVLQDPEEEIEIAFRENDAVFRTGKLTLYTRLVEGRFPRYQDVFPSSGKIRVPLPVAPFLAAVRQAKIVASEESNGVEFHFEDGHLTMVSQGVDVGESEIKMPVAYDGEPIVVSYDPQYLIDALRVLPQDIELTLCMADQRKASVFKAPDEYDYIVMPLTREKKEAAS